MIRHWAPDMAPPQVAMKIKEYRNTVGAGAVRSIVERARVVSALDQKAGDKMAATLKTRLEKLLDSWVKVVMEATEAAGERRYSEMDRGGSGRGLLFTALDDLRDQQPGGTARTPDERQFLAPTSMRDVEPSVHIYVDRKPEEVSA